MKTTKMKLGMMLLTASIAVGTVSCKKEGCTDSTAINYNEKAKKDDGTCLYPEVSNEQPNEIVSGYLTGNVTWTADKIYEIAGKVVVDNNATLTIEAGTIIKGREGSGTLASALVVAQGGKIYANGTASLPIIFTSVLDNIKVGERVGTNLTETDAGLWGGVIVLGKAPVSAQDGDNLAQIEGIPTSDAFGAFGGSDPADNSGSMTFVSIRHGGALIGAGNEINGLTLGGVGNGTTISNIEVIGNLDDGIEFFGGTVNVSNVLVAFQGDDGIDIDMNYSGTVDNFVVINGSSSDEALEVDGPEGSTYTNGMFTLSNGTCYIYGSSNFSNGDFKSKAQGTVQNVRMGTAKIRASYQNNCADAKTDALTHLINTTPTLIFTGDEVTSVAVYTSSTDDAGTTGCTVFAADQTAADQAIVSTTATGGSVSIYDWTWSVIKGKL